MWRNKEWPGFFFLANLIKSRAASPAVVRSCCPRLKPSFQFAQLYTIKLRFLPNIITGCEMSQNRDSTMAEEKLVHPMVTARTSARGDGSKQTHPDSTKMHSLTFYWKILTQFLLFRDGGTLNSLSLRPQPVNRNTRAQFGGVARPVGGFAHENILQSAVNRNDNKSLRMCEPYGERCLPFYLMQLSLVSSLSAHIRDATQQQAAGETAWLQCPPVAAGISLKWSCWNMQECVGSLAANVGRAADSPAMFGSSGPWSWEDSR